MRTKNPMPKKNNLHEKTIAWACKSLESLGYKLKSKQPENILNTPWSYVIRFETSDGLIYLKQTPKNQDLEAHSQEKLFPQTDVKYENLRNRTQSDLI